jgi:hypothetical protein
MKSKTLLWAIWAAGGLAIVLGFSREALLGWVPPPRELPRWDNATGRPWVDDGFIRKGPDQDIAIGALPPGIQAVTSWLGSDAAQGRAETAWFKAARRTIYVAVAGYPQHPGCRLWAEFRAADGAITRVDCQLTDPREEWGLWAVRRPPEAVALRLVAEDRAGDFTGWLAFSHPFRAWPPEISACYQCAQVFTTFALALTLVWGPGWWWLNRRRSAAAEGSDGTAVITPVTAGRIAGVIGTGPLILAASGALVWVLGFWIRP